MLSDAKIRKLKPTDKCTPSRPDKYSDKYGLQLLVRSTGTKSWISAYCFDGKQTRLTLGTYPIISLSEARQANTEIAARLSYFPAVSGNKLSCLPLQLTLRVKSTTQSYRTPIYFVDLTLRDDVTLKQAVQDAGAIDKELSEHGFDQAALETAEKLGYVNSCFGVDSEDAMEEVVDEFYPVETDDVSSGQQGDYQNGLAKRDVTSIEQGLRKSMMAVS